MHRQNEKIWNKTSVLIPNAPIFDVFKVPEWYVVRSLLIFLVILASVHCVQGAVGTESWSSESVSGTEPSSFTHQINK